MELALKRLYIRTDSTVKEAIWQLNDTAKKVLFVIDFGEHLIGSLTDGDIRRALLKGMDFSAPIERIMCHDPQFLPDKTPDVRTKAKRIMLKHDIELLPILDADRRIVSVLSWQELFSDEVRDTSRKEEISNPVVIMAGGKGTRLDPLTKILPKPLIPLGDKPIVEIIMENFRKHGFSKFYLVVNYKKELIKAYFNDESVTGIECVEEHVFLGTAGGLRLLRKKLDQTFFVMNCDIILESELDRILSWHKTEKALMTLVGSHREMVIPYGLIECANGGFQRIKEKPVIDMVINTGAYVMEPEVLEYIKKDEFIDMNHLIERVAAKGKVSVYPVYNGWFDTGQFKEYQETLRKVQESGD